MRTLKSLLNLSGRRALITGATGHIGRAIGEGLIELGAKVAVLDRESQSCAKVSAGFNRVRKNSAIPLPCDLSDELLLRRTIQEGIRRLGGLEILIHCAAYVGTMTVPGWAVPFPQQTVGAWDAAMRVNLTAAFVMAQEARAALSKSGKGSLILFSSIYGTQGPDFSLYKGTDMVNPAGYGASKGGLIQLGRYLATLLAPAVRVNVISPGGVWRDQPASFHRKYRDRTPLKRMAMEEDLKGAVAYLASDLSAYVTGHNLRVDGGWSTW